MRLLFVGHSAGLLGAERSMAEIIGGALADGHLVTVVLPGPGPLVEVLERAGAKVVLRPMHAWLGAWHWFPPVGLTRLVQIISSVRGLEEQIQLFRADVVVTNTSVVPAGALAAARAGVPHIWIVRESLRDNRQLRSFLPKRLIARLVLDRSSVLCTISGYVEHQLLALAGRGHSRSQRVSPNPATDVRETNPPPRSEPRVLLLPGFFSREKGQHLAILAAYLARRRGSRVQLRVVGRGRRPYATFLRALVRILRLEPDVQLLGWTDNLESEYAKAHFVVTASRNEAFGRTVVEGFAHGRPVIGFDRGATAALLREGGGIPVSPSRAGAMAEAMVAAVTMPPEDYELLRLGSSDRGAEFRHGDSQYVGFRRALAALPPAVTNARR